MVGKSRMFRHHLTRNLRSLAFLLVLAAVLAGAALLWWANRTGMPEAWRTALENEIAKQGAFVRIGGLSYVPFKGVIASDIRVFSGADKRKVISTLQRVVLDFDKTKLSRGEVRLTKVAFANASLSMPVDPDDPDTDLLEVTRANGTVILAGNRRFEVRNARGIIAGVSMVLDARITGYKPNSRHKPDPSGNLKRRQLVATILDEINRWGFDPEQPPQLGVTITGDVNDPSTIQARIHLTSKELGKNQRVLEDVAVDAEISSSLLTLTSVSARDSRGRLEGRADYDLATRDGRFEASSTLQIEPLLRDWFGIPPVASLTLAGSQSIDIQGSLRIDGNGKPLIQATGRVSCGSIMLRGVRFDAVESAFSWRDGELFLRDTLLEHELGKVRGKAMIHWPLVRMSLQSTVPGKVWQPFFTGQPLEKVIDDFTSRKDASYQVSLEGGFDATDRHSWAYTGGGVVKNVSYKGVPVNMAECRFSLSHHELDFYDGTVDFNYQDYPMRKAFSGPVQAVANVGRIRYVGASKTVEVEDVKGAFWAAPMVRLFAPKVADNLEIYRFHRPPELTGSGVVDVTPQGRTSLDISFRSAAAATYQLLGSDAVLTKPSGRVSIRGNRVSVNDIECGAFGGPIRSEFQYQGAGQLTGDVSFTRLSLSELGEAYGFEIKNGGLATGRIGFSLTGGRIETMEGDGLLALEKTELFSVPMFGPLSPLIGGILGDRRAGFERAKSAFCNYRIRKGILSTDDFQTSTTSLVFLGDGSVDLKERTIDMTMRMNARGLLGLITLPLRPFYGMFQFRGTGPLKETHWENVMFTSPPKGSGELLMEPPKARIVGGRD